MKNYFNTLLFLLCAFTSMAQAPQKFNYQAVARNTQGATLANQNIKIRANILNGSANGTVQYSETHNANTSQLGLFNLAIGGGTVTIGSFSNITWANGDKYLKIEMDATGGNNFSLVGTSQLLSVPYALNAGNGSQWKDTLNHIYFPSGVVGIGKPPSYSTSQIPTLALQVRTDFAVASFESIKDNIGAGLRMRGDSSEVAWLFTSQPKAQNYAITDCLTIDTYSDFGNSSQKVVVSPTGNVMIGSKPAKSKLEVENGDVFIDNASNGVIMKSPNGQCWRMTVSNTGQPVFTSITCPQ